MQLVSRPADFDVILTENMFGDILSDESAMLTGSLGMLPSASLGADGARGCSSRCTARRPTSRARASPTRSRPSSRSAMMLRHGLGSDDEASAVEAAVEAALDAGLRTADLGRRATPARATVGTERDDSGRLA